MEYDYLGEEILASLAIIIDESEMRKRVVGGKVRVLTEDWSAIRLQVPLEGELMDSLGAKLMAHRRRHKGGKTFTVRMPQHLGVVVPTQTIRLRAAAAARSTALPVDSTENFRIDEDTFFTVAGDPKVYQALADVGPTTGLQGTIQIDPSLRKAAPDNAILNFAPDITLRYAAGAASIRYTDNLVRKVVELEEAL